MTVYAEDVNYFNTSLTHPETWIERAKQEIHSIKGKVMQSGFAENASGIAAFSLTFQINGDTFQINWETLPTRVKSSTPLMAKRQAATLLFHDVKHKVVMAKIRGVRSTFAEYLMLPGGQTIGEVVTNIEQFKAMIASTPILLGSGK